MDDKLYWVWLSLVFCYGSNKPYRILSQYDSPEDFYNLSIKEMSELGFLTKHDIENLKSTSLKRAEKIIQDCKCNRISIVTYGDEDYPKRLKLIYGPPVLLYVKGSIANLDDNVVITVVGTRKSTDYSEYVTEYLSANMAAAGAVIVSGCAVGIDACAHSGALKAKGRTIAVLGCGLDIDYPSQNHNLKKQILENNGAVISELPPGELSSPKIFPIRNRIMAGISLGVLVTHAPITSGALITAEHAIEQGKEVFCVPPYSIFDARFAGVIRYIRDGAIPVFCADDVLGLYASIYANKLDNSKLKGDYISKKKSKIKSKKVSITKNKAKSQSEHLEKSELSVQEQKQQHEELKQKYIKIISTFDEKQLLVYNNLEFTPKYIDELINLTGLKIGELLSILTELEIMGLISFFGGKRYALCEK